MNDSNNSEKICSDTKIIQNFNESKSEIISEIIKEIKIENTKVVNEINHMKNDLLERISELENQKYQNTNENKFKKLNIQDIENQDLTDKFYQCVLNENFTNNK